METNDGGDRDWSALPQDVLLIAMSSMEVPDVVCVVLLVHMPYEELSFARPGDDRWTSLSDDLNPSLGRGYFSSAVYSERDGLFYVHALDLRGPSPPAAWLFTCSMTCYLPNCKCTG
jgi:hypothetical protein